MSSIDSFLGNKIMRDIYNFDSMHVSFYFGMPSLE